MKIIASALAIVAIAFTASACVAKSSLQLASTTFADGATIPHANSYNASGCTGDNAAPELHWSGAPAGTKSFALTMFDPDARAGAGWWHWVVYGIDSRTHELPAGKPVPGTLGVTSFGAPGYGGPCPPPGDTPHHYVFTLYALDELLVGKFDGPDLLTAIKGHVLAKAQLIGRFGR